MTREDEDSDAEHEESSLVGEESGSDVEELDSKAEPNDGSDNDDDIHLEKTLSKAKTPSTLPPKPPTGLRRPMQVRTSLGSLSRPFRQPMSRLTQADDDDDEQLSDEALKKRREENIRALVNNSLQTCRQPLLSKFLSVMEGEAVLRKPFQSPMQGAPPMSEALRRKLAARRHFVPWGSNTPLPVPTMARLPSPTPVPEPPPPPPEPAASIPEPALPEGIEPLVLWRAPPGCCEGEGGGGGEGEGVAVDNMLVRFLRPHQREGVQFMFDCVTGQRLEGKQGCILADDMGLGKTLQGISLLWTLLTSGHPALGGAPIARRALIVCPTSLVSNWDNECTKWLQGRLKTLAMCETSREDVVANIALFLHPSNVYKVLIISYETFRLHAEKFHVANACDLLMCDEAHRLKNDATLTNRALDNLICKRRVLLSGTPMQNHLDEFFAMVDFCNPGVLGAPAQFRKHYELPILAGREPDASPEEVALGEERSRELSGLTNQFILRRTNKLLSQHLPPKVIEVVCCRLTDLQRQLYCHFLQSKAARRVLNGRTSSGVLSAITSLKKLCNHPKLIYDAIHSKAAVAAGEDGEGRADGFEDVGSLFPPGLFDNGRVGRGGMSAGWEAVSGKMAVLARMLHVLHSETNDRIVLVSNYTSTLDLFAQLCRERGYPFVRLDGTTTINKRQKLVKVFNDPSERQFAFLLSSKAGGCGLNLIGANRLVLFDPDWNPANDQQAAARVWRDGQRKRVFVYRFLSTGSIEEKVYQRQLSKEGLKQLVSKNGKAAANVMTTEDLRELFSLNADSWSDTYDCMCGGPGLAGAGGAGGERGAGEEGAGGDGGGGTKDDGGPYARLPPVHKLQVGEPAEEDLARWGHHPDPTTVPDAVMCRVAAPDVSFIFSCRVAGKAIEGGDEEEQRIAAGPVAGAGATPAGRLLSGGGGLRLSIRGAGGRGLSAVGGGASGATGMAEAAPASAATPLPLRAGPVGSVTPSTAAGPPGRSNRSAPALGERQSRVSSSGHPPRNSINKNNHSGTGQAKSGGGSGGSLSLPASAVGGVTAASASAPSGRPPTAAPPQQRHVAATPSPAVVAGPSGAATNPSTGPLASSPPAPAAAGALTPLPPPQAPGSGIHPQRTATATAGAAAPSSVISGGPAAGSSTSLGPVHGHQLNSRTSAPAPTTTPGGGGSTGTTRPHSSVTGAVTTSSGQQTKQSTAAAQAGTHPKSSSSIAPVKPGPAPAATDRSAAAAAAATTRGQANGGTRSGGVGQAAPSSASAFRLQTQKAAPVLANTPGATAPAGGAGQAARTSGGSGGAAGGGGTAAAGSGGSGSGGKAGAARGREEGGGGGGGSGGSRDEPKAKRPRAPGWYINDEEDDFL